ncbi:MAG: penicillin-binding protein [Firmicutes bacterium]|nr:penicillin-binding protein [Bacillota bacterium]
MKKKRKITKAKINVRLTVFGVSLLFCIAIGKLSYVVLSNDVDGTDLTAFANNRNTVTETLPAKRGTIYDYSGEVLAQNVNSYTVIAYLSSSRTTDEKNPEHVIDKEKTANEIAPLINMTPEQIMKLLNQDLYQVELGPGGRGITELTKKQIEDLNLPGIDFIASTKRYYKMATFAPYIVGYARPDEKGKITGQMGIEAYYDKKLKGESGKKTYQQDAYGYQLPNNDKHPVYVEEAINGNDIYLTLDNSIQLIAENAVYTLADKHDLDWVTFSVMEAKTGRIVASASSPSFNLNTLDNIQSYLNPLTSYTYEPGSTMKIFSFMAAIEDGIYNGEDTFMSGTIKLKDETVIKDFNNTGWGSITYNTGFAYSSNVAATKLAQKLGTKKLKKFYESLGYGKTTDIELPGELPGKMTFTYESELANASFGQGITTTPVQNLQALSCLANNGTVLKPYIVDKIVDQNGKVVYQGKRTELNTVASKETIDQVKNLMYDVVYNGLSSSKYYAADNVKVIGKTGTAQIASPYGGYLTGKYDYIKSFAGLFPYENPEYIIYISVKQLVGETKDIADVVSDAIEEIAKTKKIIGTSSDIDKSKIIELSNYISKDTKVTTDFLEKKGLKVVVLGDGKYVINQYPLKGSVTTKDSKVFLLTNGSIFKMPDVSGWSSNELITFCKMIGLKYNINGYGNVASVSIPAGEAINFENTLEINLES